MASLYGNTNQNLVRFGFVFKQLFALKAVICKQSDGAVKSR